MPNQPRIGLYPGTFDPVTRGHMDIIQRAARVVDKLVIGVAKNTGKSPLFNTAARVKMVRREIESLQASFRRKPESIARDSEHKSFLPEEIIMPRGRAALDSGLRRNDDLNNIEVIPFDNLLMHAARDIGASVIIRGLRAVSDFEYEIQMAAMNYRMHPEIETIFLTATEGTQFIASRFVKEIARLGGDVRPFVSDAIAADLKRCFRAEKGRRKVKPEMRD